MLLLFFRNCCRILWKPLSYHHHLQCNQQQHYHPYRPPQHQYMIWIFLLFLLSQQSGSQCRPAEKWDHRIQRRFMWKQMDSSVDGFVDRVVSGARVMKGMIGEFMPPKHGNVMDYLPTETTRVRYIIRNPHTKETKVIKIRPTKKVVKIMSITPKPLMAGGDKHKSTHNMLNPEKLRQMEKEQELIAEGKMPQKHKEKNPMFMPLKSEKQKETSNKNMLQHEPSQSDDDIVSGTINEFSGSWKPVYQTNKEPSGFSTARPLAMSSLHTSVIAELLPQPQKQVYEPFQGSNDYAEQDANKPHTYEVTEYTAEESVVQPYTHEYYSYGNVPLTSLTLKGAERHSPITETQNIGSLKEDETNENHYVPDFGSQRGFLPSRTSYRSQPDTSTVAPSTTTTEEPNYPPSFLRKYRERTQTHYHTKPLSRNKHPDIGLENRNKHPDIALENSWQPSNISYSNHKHKPMTAHHQHISSIGPRYKSQQWPPELEETQNAAPSYVAPVTTDSPTSLHEFPTHSPPSLDSTLRSSDNTRKNAHLKSKVPASSSSDAADTEHHHNHRNHHQQYHKPSNVRQRGSIRFGDRLEADDG